MSKRPGILVIATNWWPLSARLAAALIENGCSVSAACPRGHPIEAVRGIGKVHSFRGFRFVSTVRLAIASAAPDLIVPADDQSTWLLHALYRTDPALRELIQRSLGDPAGYQIVQSREHLLALAASMGIRVPETAGVETEAEAESWFRQRMSPAVLKLDGSWGGRGVRIVNSPQEAADAFRRLSRPLDLPTALKRSIINSDPAALWAWRQHHRPTVTIQKLAPGIPANSMVLCWQGEVLAELGVEVLCAQSLTGAALVIRTTEQREFSSAARLLVDRLGISGFIGLDFMFDPKTSTAYLIELNPRTTQLGHLRVRGQGSLAGALAAHLAGKQSAAAEEGTGCSTIAFFPQTLQWNPETPYLRLAYHDVPWEEPSLVRMLLDQPWPERCWLYRIYHHFRPVIPAQAVEFESSAVEPVSQAPPVEAEKASASASL